MNYKRYLVSKDKFYDIVCPTHIAYMKCINTVLNFPIDSAFLQMPEINVKKISTVTQMVYSTKSNELVLSLLVLCTHFPRVSPSTSVMNSPEYMPTKVLAGILSPAKTPVITSVSKNQMKLTYLPQPFSLVFSMLIACFLPCCTTCVVVSLK